MSTRETPATEGPGFSVLRTIHSAFAVSDIERTLRLFHDFLGFEIVARDMGDPNLVESLTGINSKVKLAFIRAPDGHMIELIEWEAPYNGHIQGRVCDAGWWHMALEVDNLQTAMDRGSHYGLTIYNRVVERDGGASRVAYFRDPDGITIELSQRPRRRG